MGFEIIEELDDAVTPTTPWLAGGALTDAGQQAVQAAARLGNTRGASLARAWCVPYLVDAMERAFASDLEPTVQVQTALDQVTAFLQAAAATRFAALGPVSPAARNGNMDIEAETGEHYGTLFEAFAADSFWEEARHLLGTRLERNGVGSARYRGKRVLDAGCGGGRYSVAWRLLGASHVTGIDVSATGIEDARQRVAARGLGDVVFQQASALELPFPDRSFDVVFSNGVLHHTTDWRRGVREVVRVLAPKGLGWLYLIERPGGLLAEVVEILRLIMSCDQREVARAALHMLGTPANRVYYMLDQVMVPINHRFSSEEVASALVDAGATNIRRLTRGTDFDRIEQIYRQRPFATVKYGIGENRFVFSKE
jgi:ubiquinone/menaquinone biosynthesis C-methylase UbiE